MLICIFLKNQIQNREPSPLAKYVPIYLQFTDPLTLLLSANYSSEYKHEKHPQQQITGKKIILYIKHYHFLQEIAFLRNQKCKHKHLYLCTSLHSVLSDSICHLFIYLSNEGHFFTLWRTYINSSKLQSVEKASIYL